MVVAENGANEKGRSGGQNLACLIPAGIGCSHELLLEVSL